MNEAETHILLFDGMCNLCNGFVKFIIKRDPQARFKFASLQSVSAQTLLNKFGVNGDYLDSIVYIRGDQYYLASSAVLRVLKELGGPWKLFYVFMIVPKFIRNFIYKIIAVTRYKIFGKRESCMIPGQNILGRFLE